MSNSLAMSTSWNAKRHVGAKGVVEEIVGLGISRLEAGYSMKAEQLPELAELLPQNRVQVCSVHNFCPTPSTHKCSWGDDFLLSSLDKEQRESGVQATLETIAWAKRLGAKVIVMHLGQVPIDKTPYKMIEKMIASGEVDCRVLEASRSQVRKERARLAEPHLDAVRKSLDAIVARLPRGIVLGLETRSYHQIPTLRETQELLTEYGDAVGYWHDIGHAHGQERMGFYEKGEYLKTLGDRLIGLHIHDSLKLSDHHAPGFGEIDFESLKPYLKNGVLPILEIHPRVPRAEVVQGIEFLRTRNILP